MTKLLDEAIAKVCELPEEEQECAAESLMVFAELAKQGVYKLSAEERAAWGIVYSGGRPDATVYLKCTLRPAIGAVDRRCR
jgi:hypothetical protein